MAVFGHDQLMALFDIQRGVRDAIYRMMAIENSIATQWTVCLGRRSARERLAHLLCEFSVRFKKSTLGDEMAYELPMTQEQLGDALGLTPVHVNRVLKSLETDGLIVRKKRKVSVTDWPRLRDAAEFNERYLHLDQIRD